MIYYNKTDFSEGFDVNKAINQKRVIFVTIGIF